MEYVLEDCLSTSVESQSRGAEDEEVCMRSQDKFRIESTCRWYLFVLGEWSSSNPIQRPFRHSVPTYLEKRGEAVVVLAAGKYLSNQSEAPCLPSPPPTMASRDVNH